MRALNGLSKEAGRSPLLSASSSASSITYGSIASPSPSPPAPVTDPASASRSGLEKEIASSTAAHMTTLSTPSASTPLSYLSLSCLSNTATGSSLGGFMAYAYFTMSRGTSAAWDCLPLSLRDFLASDSACVNFSQIYTAIADSDHGLMASITEFHQRYLSQCGYAGGALLLPILAWAGLAALPVYAAADAFMSKEESYVALSIRSLLLFRALLRSPAILQNLIDKATDAWNDIQNPDTRARGIGKLSFLLLSVLIAGTYTFSQHTSISKGLHSISQGEYDAISIHFQRTLEVLGTGPLAVLNMDYIDAGLRTLFLQLLSPLKEAVMVLSGQQTTVQTLDGDGHSIDISADRIEHGIRPLLKLLCVGSLSISSGIPAIAVALAGVQHSQSSSYTPHTAFDFEKDSDYQKSISAVSYVGAAASNAPGVSKLFDDVLWPRLFSPIVHSMARLPSTCTPLATTLCCRSRAQAPENSGEALSLITSATAIN